MKPCIEEFKLSFYSNSLIINLDRVKQPVRIFKRLGVISNILIARFYSCRSCTTRFPGALVYTVAAEVCIDDLANVSNEPNLKELYQKNLQLLIL